MFKKILGNVKGSKGSKEDSALDEKIAKMNLSEMKLYIQDRVKDFPVSEEGVESILRKLTTEDTNGNLYLKIDDMDVKKKKAFDLILLIAKSKKITISSIELIGKFIEVYDDIITAYDKSFKDIYSSRFNDATSVALASIEVRTALETKMHTLAE